MIFDALPFSKSKDFFTSDIRHRSLEALTSFLERKLGVTIAYNARLVPFERADLLEPITLGKVLVEKGIIQSFHPIPTPPDEPPLKLWGATCNDSRKNTVGGASAVRDSDALFAALAEGLERYIWFEVSDYFSSPITAIAAQIQKRGNVILPERFVSFSQEQRNHDPYLHLTSDMRFLWIQGTSLVSGKRTYLPAQTVSGKSSLFGNEPRIRLGITIGLATWPTLEGARLAGALEVVERDAYMVWWFNQLTLPRVNLQKIREQSATLSSLLDACARYRLNVHAIKMLTDAPTHAVYVVVEDTSGVQPRYTFGLKAHRSLPYAIEKATTEALRSRRAARNFLEKGEWDIETPVEKVGHRDRLHYWTAEKHATALAFAVSGPVQDPAPEAWDTDDEGTHLKRIVAWCASRGYECVSVPLGASAYNPTPWHIELIVIPELQPTHLYENLRQLGGTRIYTIPEMFGYTPRKTPFIDAPHPFS